MSKRKKIRANNTLRKNYVIFLELGLIATLILFLIAFKVDYRPDQKEQVMTDKQEAVKMEEVVQTKQESEPPPPPRPQVPTEVPNDEVVEEADLDISAEIDFDQKLDIPAPPSGPEKEEEEDREQIFVIVENEP